MTRAYLYIMESGTAITLKSKFFKVWVGTSKVHANAFRYLTGYARKHGHYFHVWDYDTDAFFSRLRTGFSIVSLIPIKAPFLANSIRHGLPIELPSYVKTNQTRLELSISPTFFSSYQLRMRSHLLPSRPTSKPK